jgi:hypothetical protein
MDLWHEEDFLERRGKPIQLEENKLTVDDLKKNYIEILEKFTESKQKLENVENNNDARKLRLSLDSIYRKNVLLIDELFKLAN